MYKILSQKTVNILEKNGIIDLSDKEVYEYGFELLISSFFSIMVIITLSCFLKNFSASLLYMLGFIFTRLLCGGYHANHHSTCFILTIANYLAFSLSNTFLPKAIIPIVLIAICTISLLIMFLFAPIEHPNNPHSELAQRKLKKRCRFFSIIYLLLSLIFLCSNVNLTYFFSFMFGVFSVALSVIISKIKLLKQTTL